MKVALCIPTLNAGNYVDKLFESIRMQSFQPNEILVIDSSSTDGSVEQLNRFSTKFISIPRSSFDHGGTRNMAFAIFKADIYIFLTQDAILENEYSIERLVLALQSQESCGMVYGRQIAGECSTAFSRHARLFNYPDGSSPLYKSSIDISTLGIKAAFCSNSFSAYKAAAIEEVGYFPTKTIFAEDSAVAAKLLMKGWMVGYVPSAKVIHAHEYNLIQEFSRYFDIGVFHSLNHWYMDFLGKAEGEGMKFIRSEYSYMRDLKLFFPLWSVILRNSMRYFGYKCGRLHRYLPRFISKSISTNKAYWANAS